MLEERTFELVPVLDEATGKYAVKSFDNVKEIVSDFIEREVNRVTVISDDLTFKNVSDGDLNLDTEEEKEELKKVNEDNKEALDYIKTALNDEVVEVRFTNKLTNHPVCLTTEGNLSVEMQKVINAMPTDEKVKAKMIKQINEYEHIRNCKGNAFR